MKQIPLTQGQFALVDDQDFDELNRHKWYAYWSECTRSFYAARGIQSFPKARSIYKIRMHRQILGLERGDKSHVDHRNHNTLDNQRSNIRIATRVQNSANRRGANGASFEKRSGKWRAQIGHAGKFVQLGRFDTEEEASNAYRQASIRLNGDFSPFV